MKKNKTTLSGTKLHFIFILLAAGFFSIGTADSEQEKPAVVLLPFHIVAIEKNDLIQKGIDSVLNSRLSGGRCDIETKPSPVSGDNLSEKLIKNPSMAGIVCKEQNGDFLIFGNLVKFGDTLTTDVFLYDASRGTTTLHFSDTGKGEGALLDHLAEFTRQAKPLLSPMCFTEEKPTALKKGPQQPDPDRIIKSQDLKGVVNGIAVGDFDNDKQIDIVTATDQTINIFSYNYKEFKEKVTVTVPIKGYVVGVDAADINGNSIPEIFVSVVTEDRADASSLIIEWDGKAYKTIRSDVKWLFRTISIKGEGGPVLVAQKNKNLGSILGGPIYRFRYTANDPLFVPLDLPEDTPLYSFALSRRGTVATMRNNRIRIFDAKKGLLWESDEIYGGSLSFMAKPDISDRDKINRVYLEPRLIFRDLDRDGDDELITIKNNEATGHLFSGIKNFNKARITVLTKSDFGYSVAQETDWAGGYISDLNLTDMDSDRIPELVYSVVSKGGLFSDKKSYLVIQKMTGWFE